MGTAFNIKMDEADVRRVHEMLDDFKGMPERVFVRALNKTLTGVRTDSSAAIREVVTAKKAAVDATFKLDKPTVSNMRAAISSVGKALALIDYSTKETSKGVSVQVRKDRSRKVVPGTFLATMDSRHKGVFWREYHTVSKKKKDPDINYAALPKVFRLKIKERFGPRIPDIMGNDPVMNVILEKASDRLHENLNHETDWEMSKHK